MVGKRCAVTRDLPSPVVIQFTAGPRGRGIRLVTRGRGLRCRGYSQPRRDEHGAPARFQIEFAASLEGQPDAIGRVFIRHLAGAQFTCSTAVRDGPHIGKSRMRIMANPPAGIAPESMGNAGGRTGEGRIPPLPAYGRPARYRTSRSRPVHSPSRCRSPASSRRGTCG